MPEKQAHCEHRYLGYLSAEAGLRVWRDERCFPN